ncbi:uncharacterized protein [Antedon mediterranea]|uniref:uncharacterized protein n=1 Tax=Antedon mediterranea TaxID=105859 RepID=UPI003AF57778
MYLRVLSVTTFVSLVILCALVSTTHGTNNEKKCHGCDFHCDFIIKDCVEEVKCSCSFCENDLQCSHQCSWYVNCTSKDLNKMPRLQVDTKNLYLGSNAITTLDAYGFSNLSIISLDLINNELTESRIDDTAFSGLDELSYLRISYNTLKKVNKRWFEELRSLTIVVLRHCDITSVDGDLFDNNLNLKWVNLGDNNIRFLPSGLFKKHTKLNLVALFNNEITYIPPGFFKASSASIEVLYIHDNLLANIGPSAGLQDFPNLNKLSVFSNPFTCNCDLVWFINWIKLNEGILAPKGRKDIIPRCNDLGLDNKIITKVDIGALHCNWIWWELAVGGTLFILLVCLYLKIPQIRRCISSYRRRKQYIQLLERTTKKEENEAIDKDST